MPAMTPAQGFLAMTDDLTERLRSEARVEQCQYLAKSVNALHLSAEGAAALALAREALDEVLADLRASTKARTGEVAKAERRALTRCCRRGQHDEHYWIDAPGRRPHEAVVTADRYEHAPSMT